MKLPPELRGRLTARFGRLDSAVAVAGGDTSAAARVTTAAGERLFVKWGHGHAGRSYGPEVDGLRALAAAAPADVVVPEVLAYAAPAGEAPGFLAQRWLDAAGGGDGAAWARLGEGLAGLHAAAAPGEGYGWARDNFLGRLPQVNASAPTWPEFYARARLGAVREHVRAVGLWRGAWDGAYDGLLADLPHRLPERPARALVHGDLWAGNALVLADGRCALLDPAVYVGHAEVDLALAELFGGFPADFFAGYRAAAPPEPGYPARRDVYQLYHLVMHLLVSPGYAGAVDRVLGRLT